MFTSSTKKIVFFFIFLFFYFNHLEAQQRKVSFLFVGDAMQHKSQLDAAYKDKSYDYSSYFKHLEDKVKQADVAVVNLETTFAGKPYTGYPMFGSPDEYAVALKDAGFDIFLTANNHCLDRCKKGLERTISVLDSLKVKHTGTFQDSIKRDLYYPLMMIRNGIRIAMLNYTYGTNGIKTESPNIINFIDEKQILKDIGLAKLMKADIIIANMHWGYEYILKQHKEQEKVANFLIENGVRLVIGSHPHVVQPIDIRKENDSIKSIIVYSLGNFISGMKTIDTSGGIMVDIEISKNENNQINIDTCSYSLVWTHKKMKGDTFNSFELLAVDEFNNEDGKAYLGEDEYERMALFSTRARNAIESMWEKKQLE